MPYGPWGLDIKENTCQDLQWSYCEPHLWFEVSSGVAKILERPGRVLQSSMLIFRSTTSEYELAGRKVKASAVYEIFKKRINFYGTPGMCLSTRHVFCVLAILQGRGTSNTDLCIRIDTLSGNSLDWWIGPCVWKDTVTISKIVKQGNTFLVHAFMNYDININVELSGITVEL